MKIFHFALFKQILKIFRGINFSLINKVKFSIKNKWYEKLKELFPLHRGITAHVYGSFLICPSFNIKMSSVPSSVFFVYVGELKELFPLHGGITAHVWFLFNLSIYQYKMSGVPNSVFFVYAARFKLNLHK